MLNDSIKELNIIELKKFESHVKTLFPYLELKEILYLGINDVAYSQWRIHILHLTWIQALAEKDKHGLNLDTNPNVFKHLFIEWVTKLLPINTQHGLLAQDTNGDFTNAEAYRMYLTWLKALNLTGDFNEKTN